MLIIGSHVSYKKNTQLLGSLEEALSYNANTFMFYTGAPQNTLRNDIDDNITFKALEKMKENGINRNDVIVHAPYIINLANKEKQEFSIKFLIEECGRCESLFMDKLVLHPGSHVGYGIEQGIENIADSLNEVLKHTTTTILLETMAGKGSEVGSKLEEIKEIIEKINEKDKIGICLDTCHLQDAGYDIENFDEFLSYLDKLDLFKYVKCIHINDSKNPKASHKDRHENFGYGTIGFETLLNIVYNKRLENIPKILETPYIDGKPPYKEEIEMIRNKKFNDKLKN